MAVVFEKSLPHTPSKLPIWTGLEVGTEVIVGHGKGVGDGYAYRVGENESQTRANKQTAFNERRFKFAKDTAQAKIDRTMGEVIGEVVETQAKKVA